MIRRPPRSTLFPTRRSSDLVEEGDRHFFLSLLAVADALGRVEGDAQVGRGIVVGEFHVHAGAGRDARSEEHTSELQSLRHLGCRLLLEKKKLGCYRSSIV